MITSSSDETKNHQASSSSSSSSVVRKDQHDDDDYDVLQELLPEIWQSILRYLNVHDLCCKVSLLNKEFNQWANANDELWEIHTQRLCRGKQNVQFILASAPSSSSGATVSSSCVWKDRYKHCILDSQRTEITREEFLYYKWELLYNGIQSKLGLRQFNNDNTYHSPYAGIQQWTIHHNQLCLMGMILPIERNPNNWGWVIGRNYRTVYNSVEQQ